MTYQKIEESTMDRMKKFVASENRMMADKGRRLFREQSYTFDEALSELLTKAGF